MQTVILKRQNASKNDAKDKAIGAATPTVEKAPFRQSNVMPINSFIKDRGLGWINGECKPITPQKNQKVHYIGRDAKNKLLLFLGRDAKNKLLLLYKGTDISNAVPCLITPDSELFFSLPEKWQTYCLKAWGRMNIL